MHMKEAIVKLEFPQNSQPYLSQALILSGVGEVEVMLSRRFECSSIFTGFCGKVLYLFTLFKPSRLNLIEGIFPI